MVHEDNLQPWCIVESDNRPLMKLENLTSQMFYVNQVRLAFKRRTGNYFNQISDPNKLSYCALVTLRGMVSLTVFICNLKLRYTEGKVTF